MYIIDNYSHENKTRRSFLDLDKILLVEGSLCHNQQGQQQIEFLHVEIGPLFHEGCPFSHYFQRKLLSGLLLIPWCLIGAKLNY